MNTPIIIPLTPVTLTSVILSFFKPSYQKLEAPDENVSVIIPAYNEEKNITQCIDSLVNQTKKPKEIILSNNGSTDSTKTTVEDYLRKKSYTLESVTDKQGVQASHYKDGEIKFIVLEHKNKTSKPDSINFANTNYAQNARVMVVDSDTYFLEDFIKEASKCFYILHKPKKTKNAIVEKISSVCGTVLSDYKKDAGWQEKFVARARTLEYNMGQFLTKLGQNKLAIYVVSGCGFIADKSILNFDSKTVTEDINFTWTTQCLQNKDRNLSLEELASLNLYTLDGKDLSNELKEFDGNIIFRNKGKVLYQPSAFMVTQDPKTLRGLMKQLSRWKGGLHQNLVLEGKNVRKGNKMMALVSHATELEGTLSGVYCYGLPVFTGLCYAFDMGMSYEVPLTMMGLDFALRSLFALTANYRCNRTLKKQNSGLEAVKQTVQNILPYYMIEFFNSYQFLKTQITTSKDVYIQNKREWNSSWERVNSSGT